MIVLILILILLNYGFDFTTDYLTSTLSGTINTLQNATVMRVITQTRTKRFASTFIVWIAKM